jgi:hypothetical protein
VITHASNFAVPVGNVGVCVPVRNVEHDDGAVAPCVIAVAESTEFHLSSGIPTLEAYLSPVGVEHQRVNFDADGGDVPLLELSGQVTLDEGGLPRPTVADEDQLKDRNTVHAYLKRFERASYLHSFLLSSTLLYC